MNKNAQDQKLPEKLLGVLPRDLRQLLGFVPGHGWDAIEWRPLLKQMRRMAWQVTSGAGVSLLVRSIPPIPGLQIKKASGVALSELTKAQRKATGDTILYFYFRQFLNPQGMFLDLRYSRFVKNRAQLHFLPNGLHAQLDSKFRLGMIDLYRGFYSPDPELLDRALYDMGFLRKDLGPEETEELRGLLQAHFGSQQRSQRFSIEVFKESFNALFDFFIEHDYQLRSDFVMVGLYLITLYLVLEDLGQSHDVKAICERALLHPRD
ncbi:hypothetical protein [Congregibacter litoralis]|uniref:Uncharacterized protein n=1 Tax=Congregibacter litoralis KT71 TaxID=314285 RepID=A4A948_9GAMM|nr:hypothetical protein [Congregibacter litoralis]EAQ97590.1 hypothetical protein KT71_04755 [Congregibacter litoralis KT71]